MIQGMYCPYECADNIKKGRRLMWASTTYFMPGIWSPWDPSRTKVRNLGGVQLDPISTKFYFPVVHYLISICDICIPWGDHDRESKASDSNKAAT